MEKVTFTPTEFAAVFGKERTWAYRQLYAGKVQAVTDLGRTMIPKSEVDRLLKEAGRYVGAGTKSRKVKKAETKNPSPSPGAKQWSEDVKRRRTRGKQPQASARCEDDHKPSSPKLPRPYVRAILKLTERQPRTRYKSSQNNGEDRGV